MQSIYDNNITLIEDCHRYELDDDPKFGFTSCTTFVDYFFEPFDRIGIANRLTSTNPKYLHMASQELVEEWESVAEEGAFVHSEIEECIKNSSEPTNRKSILAANWLQSNLIDQSHIKLFPEVIVYSKELEIAGTIDLLVYDERENEYKIFEWKTSKKINLQSYNNRMGTHRATNHLMDSNYYHYSLQLSLYRYLSEKYYGLKVTETSIGHLSDDNLEFYKTEYYFAEIEEMIEVDKKILKNEYENGLTTEFI